MNIRPTQSSSYQQVKAGIALNFAKLLRAQEQLSSGKRILRPSDDPVGAALALALKRRLSDIARQQQSIVAGKPLVDAGMSALDDASGALSDARTLVLQGLNGTLSAGDRLSLSKQIEQLKERLLESANASFDGRYLFAGADSSSAPFSVLAHDPALVTYGGSDLAANIPGVGDEPLTIGVPGSQVFAKFEPTGVSFGPLTGASSGTSADQGTGYAYLDVRHDGTTGTLGAGLALVGAGAQDTFLGDRTLTIDATAGTVQLGTGPVVQLADITGAGASDVTLTDEHGAVVHLDFSGYSGGDVSTTLSGAGSISLDGSTYVALDFAATDLELSDASAGRVLHVDTTAIHSAGSELVTFDGTVNAFDVLQGIADDLANIDGLDTQDLIARLSTRLGELDRNFGNLQLGQGVLGATSERLASSTQRLGDLDLAARELLSKTEDADLSSVILDLTRAEQTLQATQATGARLIQNTLLDYLR